MIRDPIVEEVREIRRKTEAACGHDWDKLLSHYLQVQHRAQQRVISGSPKRLARAAPEKPS